MKCGQAKWLPRVFESVQKENQKLREALEKIDKALRVPSAEYVPAIGDVFTIIDKALEQSE